MKDDPTLPVKQLVEALVECGIDVGNNCYIINREWFVPFLGENAEIEGKFNEYIISNAKMIVDHSFDEYIQWVEDVVEIMEMLNG